MTFNEGIRVQEALTCLLCDREGRVLYRDLRDRQFDAPGTWELLHCSGCGFVWLNPRPIAADVGRLYQTYYIHDAAHSVPRLASVRSRVRDSVLVAQLGYKGLGNSPLQRSLGKVVSFIGPIREGVEIDVMTLNAQERGKLLDVGCGNGKFLAKMRELGWVVYGVEPDGQAVKAAREWFGLDVHEGNLYKASFPSNTFDAISMNHVIEHVLEPIGLLEECQRVLKPSGRLVVVTPNIQSLGHRLFKESWAALNPPHHLYLFSPESLSQAMVTSGFSVLDLRCIAKGAGGNYAMSRCIRSGRKPLRNHISDVLGIIFAAVERFAMTFNNEVGEHIILSATRR